MCQGIVFDDIREVINKSEISIKVIDVMVMLPFRSENDGCRLHSRHSSFLT